MEHRSRRQFLREVGRGMLAVSVAGGLASELDLGIARADEGPSPLNFGPLEPLVALLQETPIAKLIPA
ncbi:MAG TPA: hypothetical protein VMT52_19000, partial [Planctomycetota bacterium]|nr:hypothetical protein [Planctomycetota bacterium]